MAGSFLHKHCAGVEKDASNMTSYLKAFTAITVRSARNTLVIARRFLSRFSGLRKAEPKRSFRRQKTASLKNAPKNSPLAPSKQIASLRSQ
jgi:hypothetical protein